MGRSTPRQTAFDPDTLVPAAVVGDFLGLTDERVRVLAEEGVIPREGKGKFPLRSCIRAYCAWARDEQRKASKSASASRVTDARAREIELRVAEREHRLVDTERALAIVEDIVGIYRTGFGGLPARVTRDIGLRRQIETAIDGIQTEVAKALGQRAADLRAGRETLDAVPEDDA